MMDILHPHPLHFIKFYLYVIINVATRAVASSRHLLPSSFCQVGKRKTPPIAQRGRENPEISDAVS